VLEGGNRLRDAVLEHLELLLRQVGDGLAVGRRVHVHLDEVHRGAKRRPLLPLARGRL